MKIMNANHCNKIEITFNICQWNMQINTTFKLCNIPNRVVEIRQIYRCIPSYEGYSISFEPKYFPIRLHTNCYFL